MTPRSSPYRGTIQDEEFGREVQILIRMRVVPADPLQDLPWKTASEAARGAVEDAMLRHTVRSQDMDLMLVDIEPYQRPGPQRQTEVRPVPNEASVWAAAATATREDLLRQIADLKRKYYTDAAMVGGLFVLFMWCLFSWM